MTEKRKTKAGQLPGAEMAGVEHELLPVFGHGSFEVLPPAYFNELFQLVAGSRRHLAEESELAAKTVKTLAEELSALLLRLFREGETKISGPYAP
jgi:hypothetical protein